MDFTWGHVFLLAEQMFKINDAKVAERLNVSRYTINRHKNSSHAMQFCCPEEVDIYDVLFAPTDCSPKMMEKHLELLKDTLNGDDFPASVRNLTYTKYKSYINHLLTLAFQSGQAKKKKQPSESNAPISDTAPEDICAGSPSSDDQADKTQSVWDPGPVFMPDEFYESLVDYEMEDFIKLDPTKLFLIEYMTAKEKPDGMHIIKNAIRFVKHIEESMHNTEISTWNEGICEDIKAYTKTLHEYIDFLLRNSSGLNIYPFLLDPDDDSKFEHEANEYRRKLQSQAEKILDPHSRWGGWEMYSNFPGY